METIGHNMHACMGSPPLGQKAGVDGSVTSRDSHTDELSWGLLTDNSSCQPMTKINK